MYGIEHSLYFSTKLYGKENLLKLSTCYSPLTHSFLPSCRWQQSGRAAAAAAAARARQRARRKKASSRSLHLGVAGFPSWQQRTVGPGGTDWVGRAAVSSDELNLSHSHRNILFYCVLAVKYSSEKKDKRQKSVCSSMSYDILSVCNLIVS